MLAAVLLVMTVVLAGGPIATAWAMSDYLDSRVATRLEAASEQIRDALALNIANQGGMRVNERQLDLLLGDRSGLILVIDGAPGFSVSLPQVPVDDLVAAAQAHPGQVGFLGGEEPAAAITIATRGLSVTLDGTSSPVDVDSVVLALSRADDRQTVRRLIRIGLLVGFVALVGYGLLVVIIVRAGLRPLTDLAEAVQAVGRGERAAQTVPTTDSTETAQLALAVREAFTARARAEDRLRSFVADASHELRTPLTKISGWVDLYLQGGLADEDGAQAAMEKVEAEVGRMGLLVEELSLLARLDAQVPLDLVGTDLDGIAALVEEVLEDARVIATDRSFELHLAAPPDRAVVVEVDAERLRRVLRNLVGNAVQHTPAGTPVEVTLELVASAAQTDRSALTLSVRDHGEGIPAEQVSRVFERFWRAQESRTRARGGSGLGLAIVEAVVVAHGGSVGVRSQVGPDPHQGTTVTITLPTRAAPTPGDRAEGN